MRSSVRSSGLPCSWLVGARAERGYRLAHRSPHVLVVATPEEWPASVAEQLANARDPPRFHGLAGPKAARQLGELISRRVHAVACGRNSRTRQTSLRARRKERLHHIVEHTARPRTPECLGAKCQRGARVRRGAGGQGPVQLRGPEAHKESAPASSEPAGTASPPATAVLVHSLGGICLHAVSLRRVCPGAHPASRRRRSIRSRCATSSRGSRVALIRSGSSRAARIGAASRSRAATKARLLLGPSGLVLMFRPPGVAPNSQ